MLNDGQEPDTDAMQAVQSKITVTTAVTKTLPIDEGKLKPSKGDREEERGRFQGSDVSVPYKSPDIKGISLSMDTTDDKERPDEDKLRSKTTITTLVTEEKEPEQKEEDIGQLPGWDISRPYKSPEIEGISLATDEPEDKVRSKTTVTTTVTETIQPENDKRKEDDSGSPKDGVERGRFPDSDISHSYKSPEIEGISLATDEPADVPKDKLLSTRTVTTVITETTLPKDTEEEEDRFRGSDISHPYKSPETDGISLVTDIPDEEDKIQPKATVTTTVTETISPIEEDKERFRGSDISHPYKSPDIEGISLATDEPEDKVRSKTTVTTTVTETIQPGTDDKRKQHDEESPKDDVERGRFPGSDISRPYKSSEIEGISLTTDLPTDIPEDKLHSTKTVTTVVTETTLPEDTEKEEDRFRGSDISHPYKSPDIEGISLATDLPKEDPEDKLQSKTTITTTVTETITPKEEEKGRFPGSDISYPYKTPEIEGISLVTDIPDEEDKIQPKATVTMTVTETISPIEEDKERFRGSDISHPYKSPDIEGISLATDEPEDVPEDKLHSAKTVTTVIAETTLPKDTEEEEDRFRGSDISRPYKSPDIEGISLVTDLPKEEPEDKLRSKTTVTTTVTETITPKEEEKGRFQGSDISHPYKTPEIEGISLARDFRKDKDNKEEPLVEDVPSTTIAIKTEDVPSKTITTTVNDEPSKVIATEVEDEPSRTITTAIEDVPSKTITTADIGITTPQEEIENPEGKNSEERKEDIGRFIGSDISHPYKSPEIEGISLIMDDRKEPAEDKLRSKTTVSTVVTETISPAEKEDHDIGRFRGSDSTRPYKSPDIEGISMYNESTDVQPKRTVTTVVTDTITEPAHPDKVVDDTKPEGRKAESGRFPGSDISRPYKSPEIDGISLATDLPKEESYDKLRSTVTKTVTITPKEEEKSRFPGSDISHPYKSPELEAISLATDLPEDVPEENLRSTKTITTVVTETTLPKDEEEEEDRFRGSDISRPYKSPDIEGISLVTDLPKEEPEDKLRSETTVTTTVTETITPKEEEKARFPDSDISHPYKSPELEAISLATDLPEDVPEENLRSTKTITTVVTETTLPKDEEEEEDRFRGSDISRPYKSPDIEGISLVTDLPKEEPEDKLRSETTVTTTVTETITPKEEEKARFPDSDISHPYKTPEIEAISLIADVPKHDKEEAAYEKVQPTKPKEMVEDKGRFQGSADISIKYKAPEIEGVSLSTDVQEKKEPAENEEPRKVDRVDERKPEEKRQDIGRFRGSDISQPYIAPEMDGIELVTEERKPGEKSDVTVTTTTTTVIDGKEKKEETHIKKVEETLKPVTAEEPTEESDEEWFESNEETTRTETVTVTKTDEKEQDQPSDLTVTVKKTVTTTVIDNEPVKVEEPSHPEKTGTFTIKVEEGRPSKIEAPAKEPQEVTVSTKKTKVTTVIEGDDVKKDEPKPVPMEPERTSDVRVTVKKTVTTTVIDGDKPGMVVPGKDDKQPTDTTSQDVSTVRTVTTKTVTQKEEPATPDENEIIYLRTDTALITGISEVTIPRRGDIDQTEQKEEESDEEWFESNEDATKRTTVTKKVTTIKGDKIKSEPGKRRRQSADDILGDDEWSDSDEMSTKTETITTTVTTIKGDDKVAKDDKKIDVVDKPAKPIGKKEKDQEGWSDSYSITKTIRTVVSSLKGEDKPDHQAKGIKAFGDKTGKVEGDREWSDSSEFATKTQTVTTVVTGTPDSHEFGDQRVSTISTEMGIAGEGTETVGDTTEVTRRTTIVERNTNIVAANQVSSTIFLHVHDSVKIVFVFGVAQKQNCRTFIKYFSL